MKKIRETNNGGVEFRIKEKFVEVGEAFGRSESFSENAQPLRSGVGAGMQFCAIDFGERFGVLLSWPSPPDDSEA